MTRDFGSSKGIGGHHSPRARTDVWLTPPFVLEELGGALSFDLDPCAADPRPWDTAKAHYTEADNGLTQPWHGRIWLNPPYSNSTLAQWLGRMADHGCGTGLIFARTETAAFFRNVWEACDSLLFLEGRLNFHLPDGRRAKRNAGAPSVLCAYGESDTDILAGCGLDGAFVPLRLRVLTFGYQSIGTWAQEIARAMRELGGKASLADLYRFLAGSPKTKRNSNWQAKIRQMLQSGPYRNTSRGQWELI